MPPWVRVQDCAIVAISSPDRWACPDGKVYTSFDLSRARTREYELPSLPPPAPIVLTAYPEQPSAPVEKMVLRGVHFDFNKADIRAQDAAVLDDVKQCVGWGDALHAAVAGDDVQPLRVKQIDLRQVHAQRCEAACVPRDVIGSANAFLRIQLYLRRG